MPEPFQVCSPLGDGEMSQITNRECAINRQEEKAGADFLQSAKGRGLIGAWECSEQAFRK